MWGLRGLVGSVLVGKVHSHGIATWLALDGQKRLGLVTS